jgi:hypothetical protein
MTQLSEEQQRIRSYLQAQAAKLSVAEIMDKVRADSEQLHAAAQAAMAIDASRRPSPEDWSVNEVLRHLQESSARVNAGILAAAFQAQQPGAVADRIEATDDVRPPIEWVGLLRREREATFARLTVLRGGENLSIRWNHPFFGDLNWREWLLFLRLHDLDHAGQVRQIVAALAGG